MVKLKSRQKLSVMKGYFRGDSFESISHQVGVSTGSVANIVSELKEGKFSTVTDLPKIIDDLRELSMQLRKAGMFPTHCLVGLAVLQQMRDCGLEPGDLRRLPLMLKGVGSEEEAESFVQAVSRILSAEKRMGAGVNEIAEKVGELETRASQLDPLAKKFEGLAIKNAELEKRRHELGEAVSGLDEKSQTLARHVRDMQKIEKGISSRVVALQSKANKADESLALMDKTKRELAGIGLSLEELGELRTELKTVARRHKVEGAALIARLTQELKKLAEGIGLEALVAAKQEELRDVNEKIKTANRQHDALTSAIESIKTEKAGLESSVAAIREKVANEISRMVPAARLEVDTALKEIRRGHTDALAHLKEQELEHRRIVAILKVEGEHFSDAIGRASRLAQKAIDECNANSLAAVKHATEEMAKDIRTWGDARSQLSTHLEDLKLARYFGGGLPLTAEGLNKLIDEIDPFIVSQYLGIAEVFCRKYFNHKSKPPKWVTSKYYRITEFSDVETVDLMKWASELIFPLVEAAC